MTRSTETAAVRGREDERMAVRMTTSKSMRLQFATQLTGDRNVAGASLALRLLLTVEQPMAAAHYDDRLVAELEVAPAQSFELRHA